MSILAKKYFRDEAAAFAHLERVLWPEGPICEHCGTIGKAGRLNGVKGKNGKTRPGLWKCYSKGCRKQFTVKVGTVFECAHIPLHKVLQAVYLLCSSKKGISSHQLHRTLQVDYKSAWFLTHRIREAMRDGVSLPGWAAWSIPTKPISAAWRASPSSATAAHTENVVMTLVERGGSARSFHIDNTSVSQIAPILRQNVRRESRLMTDEAQHYKAVGKEFADHGRVEHSVDEYVRGDIHTNTVEGYYSIFKRGMKGVYQHCKEKHLHRYLAEFDFRYSNRVALGVDDQARTTSALKGITGKRLTYRGPDILSAG